MEDSLLKCPTPEGESSSLFSHQIPSHVCHKRQDTHYHKCMNCSHSEKNGYVLTPLPPLVRKPKRAPTNGVSGSNGTSGEHGNPSKALEAQTISSSAVSSRAIRGEAHLNGNGTAPADTHR